MRFVLLCVVVALAAAPWAAAQDAPGDPRELYAALNAVRVDTTRVYFVRDVTLRRDAVQIHFSEGKLAFLGAVNGRVTGAVFTGRGRALAVPRDPVEKRSLARFVGTPLLEETFTRAYLRFTDSAAQELERQFQRSGAPASVEPSFGEEWDSVVANLNPWHSLRVLADWLAAEPMTYFYAGLMGEKSGPFDVMMDNRQPEQILLGQPKWVGGARFYDVWAQFPRYNAPAYAAPVLPISYRIATTILPDHQLEGGAIVELRAVRDGERMIALELSRFLKVEQVASEAGLPLVFFQNEELSTRHQIAQRGNDSLFVVLGERARAGQTIRLRIAYRGQVISDAGNGVLFVGDRGSWYPHVSGAGHFSTFDLSFRWPRKLQLVATGRKLEEKEEGEWKTGRWQSEKPIPVAGFNLGEYSHAHVDGGRFSIEVYANSDLETAVLSRFTRGSPPPTMPRRPNLPPNKIPPPGPMVTVPDAPPPSPAAGLKQVGNTVADAIHFYEKMSGPFPFERLTVAQIPGAFGQGWPGLLYLSTLSFLSESAQARAGISPATQEHFSELVPMHEVAHQWWGGAVGWSSYRDQWIQEGLAHYLALMFSDSADPGDRPLTRWLEASRRELTSPLPDGDATVNEVGPLVLGNRLRSSKSPAAYTQIVYGKGAWVFHMLRNMLRDPKSRNPDERFARLLTSLAESYRQRTLSTADLQKAVEKVMTPQMDLESSRSMDWFFDQWVRGTGIPRYAVEFTAQPQPNGTFVVRGKLKQRGVPETFLASVPVYATTASGKPALLGNVVTSGAETSFRFVTRTAPKKLLVDPEMTLLVLTP